MTLWKGLIAGTCLLLSALFSYAEVSVLGSSRREIASGKGRDAENLRKLMVEAERLLMVIMSGYILANLGFALLMAQGVLDSKDELFPTWSESWVLVAVTAFDFVLVTLFGEILPRVFAVREPYKTAKKLTPFLSGATLFLSWPSYLLSVANHQILSRFGVNPLSRGERLEKEVEALGQAGVLGEGVGIEEGRMIRRALRFEELTLRDVMTPRVEVDGFEAKLTLAQAARSLENGRSRYPIFEGSIDHTVGVLHAKDILGGEESEASLGSLCRQVIALPAETALGAAFGMMRGQRKHIVVVLDEFGGMDGIVTMDDILEEVVGEIEDEHSGEDPGLVHGGPGEVILRPAQRVDEAMEALGLFPGSPPDDLVGPLFYRLHGQIPKEGERVSWEGARIEVLAMEGTRIKRLKMVVEDSEQS
ncbi:HlyC/CorC family transporter [bacterium]|nr:HlyC/CorC family transporter [bacterium]